LSSIVDTDAQISSIVNDTDQFSLIVRVKLYSMNGNYCYTDHI